MARVYFRFKKSAASRKKLAPDNGTWWLDYTGTDKSRVREPCAAVTKTQADELLRDVLRRQERAMRGLEVLAGPITFRKTGCGYMDAQKHLASYPRLKADLELHVFPHLGDRLLAEITPAEVDTAIQAERAAGRAEGSLKRYRVRIGAVYRWATHKARLYSGPNPVAASTPVRVPERAPRYFTLEQLEKLLANAGEYRLPLAFAALTGMRKGELAGLRWDDVEWEAGVVHVRRGSASSRTTKGFKERVVPLPPDLLAQLRELKLRTKGPWVFAKPDGTPFGRTWHTRFFYTALRKAGLKDSGLLFKSLRSTYATHLMAATGDIRLVQVLLGHSRPEVTARAYAHAHLDYLRKGVAAHPLAGLGGHAGGTQQSDTQKANGRKVTK